MGLTLENGIYKIGGVDALDVCRDYGLPLYVYDGQTIAQKFDRLKKAFPVKDLRIHFACKALSTLGILRFMRELGANLDAVTLNEILIRT